MNKRGNFRTNKVIRLLYYLPMERMKKENKIHLEWAKVYWPQDYEVVDELKKLKEENRKLKEDVEYFRQIYLDLKKMCENDGYLLTDEEVTKLFNLDEIK
jgi:hypothetical protein